MAYSAVPVVAYRGGIYLFFIIQRICGVLLLIFGVVLLFMGNGGIPVGGALLFGGFVLISLAELVDLQRGIYRTAMGLPYSQEQINLLIRSSKRLVSSESLSIYPNNETEYPIIQLNGQSYIRARALVNYMEQSELTYTFQFPNADPVVMRCAARYAAGVNLFGFHDQVFVNLAELPVTASTNGDYFQIESKAAQ